jgi:hypothetical protein
MKAVKGMKDMKKIVKVMKNGSLRFLLVIPLMDFIVFMIFIPFMSVLPLQNLHDLIMTGLRGHLERRFQVIDARPKGGVRAGAKQDANGFHISCPGGPVQRGVVVVAELVGIGSEGASLFTPQPCSDSTCSRFS